MLARNLNLVLKRYLSIKNVKYSFTLKDEAEKEFESGFKHRLHPGRRHNPCVKLPLKLHMAALSVINKYQNKRFRWDIDRINQEFLQVFVGDDEKPDVNSGKRKLEFDSSIDHTNFKDSIKENFNFKKSSIDIFNQQSYNSYECAAYMASRLPANYAALSSIFNEIRHEEPHFVPKTLFDFGSGLGTSIWAADKYWKDSIREYFCVDLNENMNELSRELLQKGTTYNDDVLLNTFYRQFLPVKHLPQYDLVVSAFSLLDQIDTRNRIYVVENLWQKTSGMLVLVEHGSKAGFNAIMEARNFLLQISKSQLEPKAKPNYKVDQVSTLVQKPMGSIVAPCPHEHVCPRQLVLNHKSFCNFSAAYNMLDYGQQNLGVKTEKFAYVVIKKNNWNWSEEQKSWPRLVQSSSKNSGHTVCRVCSSDGFLKQIIVSKSKSSPNLYRCVRKSDWGDKLPVNISQIED